MANTGNTQQQINYGAAANDGQGDPLRTAFIKTDDNFDAIWNTGPVGSNITILNNTVQSNNTNGNIVLRPNGVGVIQANASILPNATNLRDLGSAGQRFRAAYIGTGGLSVDGNVTVTGNLTAGNISYTGNVFVGDLQGSVYADDSTIMVDAVDNEMFADRATFEVLSVTDSLLVSSAGNAFTIFDDLLSFPSGASWRSDRFTLDEYIQSAVDGYINITTFDNSNNEASEIQIEHGIIDINFYNGANVSWSFDDSGNFTLPGNTFAVNYANGTQVSLSNYGNANVLILGETGWTGNIIPSANAVYSLGNATNYWSNLWVANNTIYIGGVPLGISAGNVLTVAGEPVLSNDSDATITTTGNITANYFIGDGSQLTNLPTAPGNLIENGTSNVTIDIPNGNITVSANTQTWTFDTAGNLALPDNGSIIVDGGDGVIGPVSDDLVIAWDNEEIRLVSVQGSIEMQADNAFRVQTNYDGGTDTYLSRWEFNQDELVNITGNSAIVTEAGDLTLSGGRNGLASGNVSVVAVNNGVAINTWTFGLDSNLTLPSEGNIVGITPNNAGRIQWVGNSSGDGFGYTTLGLIPDDTLVGNDQYLIIDPTAPGHIHIRAGGAQDNSNADLFLGGENSYFKVNAGPNNEVRISANSWPWTFGSDGTFTLPANAGLNGSKINSVANSSGDGAGYTTLQLIPDVTVGTGTDQYLIVDPTAPGHIHIRAGGTQDDSSADLILGGENSHVKVTAGANPPVYVLANNQSWIFGVDGVLQAPGDISTSGNIIANTAGFAIGYRDIPQVAFTGNATMAAADAGKHFYSTESTDYILTIADNSAVSWPVGTAVTVVNRGTGNITVAQASGVSLYLAGNSTAGNRTVSTYGMATVLNVAANVWMINGTGVA